MGSLCQSYLSGKFICEFVFEGGFLKNFKNIFNSLVEKYVLVAICQISSIGLWLTIFPTEEMS